MLLDQVRIRSSPEDQVSSGESNAISKGNNAEGCPLFDLRLQIDLHVRITFKSFFGPGEDIVRHPGTFPSPKRGDLVRSTEDGEVRLP